MANHSKAKLSSSTGHALNSAPATVQWASAESVLAAVAENSVHVVSGVAAVEIVEIGASAANHEATAVSTTDSLSLFGAGVHPALFSKYFVQILRAETVTEPSFRSPKTT